MSSCNGDDGSHAVPPASFMEGYIKQENPETAIGLSHCHTPYDCLDYAWVEVKEESKGTDVKTSSLADPEGIPANQFSLTPLTSSDFPVNVKQESEEGVIEHTQIQPPDISSKMQLPMDTLKKCDTEQYTAPHKVLNERVEEHHNDRPLEWWQCDYKPTRNRQLAQHHHYYSGEKLHHCQFEYCGGNIKCKFKTDDAHKLKEHIKIHEKVTAEKKSIAKIEAKFNTPKLKANVKFHQVTKEKNRLAKIRDKLIADKDRGVASLCKFCYFTVSVESMPAHLLIAHTIIHKNAYQCALCQYKTRSKQLLMNHFKRHSKKDYDSHVLDHNKYYVCLMCEFKATAASHLTAHMREHAPKFAYQCTFCLYRTQSSELITKHMQCHTNEKRKKMVWFHTEKKQ